MQLVKPDYMPLAIRHWWLTTGIGAVLSGVCALALYLIDGGSEVYSVYSDVISSTVLLGAIGWFCGLLGLWWVRLIFRWAVATRSSRLTAGIGLLLTYSPAVVYFFLAGPRFGFILLPWCVASLLALRWVPLQAE